MVRTRAHRSRKVGKDCMPNDAAIFDTLGIFERGQTDILVRVFGDAMMRSAERYKLFLRLGTGDGALPKSVRMRRKATFWCPTSVNQALVGFECARYL